MKNPETNEKYTNQHELKTQTKRIISAVEKGNRYFVLRYSDPVAVLLSVKDYCQLVQEDPERCKRCRADIKATLDKINKKL